MEVLNIVWMLFTLDHVMRPGLGLDLFGMERCVFLWSTSHQFFSCKTRQWIPLRHLERDTL